MLRRQLILIQNAALPIEELESAYKPISFNSVHAQAVNKMADVYSNASARKRKASLSLSAVRCFKNLTLSSRLLDGVECAAFHRI